MKMIRCTKCQGEGREPVHLLRQVRRGESAVNDWIGMKRTARPGHVWVFTETGQERWRQVCERDGHPKVADRWPGRPVHEYFGDESLRTTVPAIWVAKGYVKEEAQ